MKRALLLVLCTAALPALAWEGVIDTKLSAGGGGVPMDGTGTITIKGLSARMESQIALPSGPMKNVTLVRAEEPGVTYLLDEKNKTYQKDTVKAGADHEAAKWTVKKLGTESIAGRSTEHVQLEKEGGGDQLEAWIDTKLVSSSELSKLFSSGVGGGAWWASLEKAGVAGVPLKVIYRAKSGRGVAQWEATRVQPKSVPSSTFQIPAGYTEGAAGYGIGAGAAGKLTPEQQQQLQDMMKKRAPAK